jgi:hypothetical protein
LEFRVCKRGALERRVVEEGALKPRAVERGALELRVIERRALELRPKEGGAMEVRIVERCGVCTRSAEWLSAEAKASASFVPGSPLLACETVSLRVSSSIAAAPSRVTLAVMPGLEPGIQSRRVDVWMAGSSPAMTPGGR